MLKKGQFTCVKGDITALDVGAIVNAANSSLLGGGGVDGAIHQAAGPNLLEECRTLGGCHVGDAKLTQGYNLKAPYIIHTVGPVWYGGDEKEAITLECCYLACLDLAIKHRITTVAFPAISCGVYAYPAEEAVLIAVTTVVRKLSVENRIEKVIFCAYSEKMKQLYEVALDELFEKGFVDNASE
jgi:O-acetyl-ADP-ribose deacetylase (regulator of RNase III)